MKNLLLFLIAAMLTVALVIGCSSSSSNPTSSTPSTYEMVGTWRHVGYAMQQTGGGYQVLCEPTDSVYMRIDSTGRVLYEAKNSTGVVYLRFVGHGSYTAPTSSMTIDSLYQTISSGLTVGQTMSNTVAFSHSNGVMIFTGVNTQNGLPSYEPWIKVGTDVKLAGFTTTIGNPAAAVGNVPVTNRRGVLGDGSTIALTTSNGWGFWVFTGLTPEPMRAGGSLNGVAYDGNGVAATTPGCYLMHLEP